jgi:phosphohistidine phosphatase
MKSGARIMLLSICAGVFFTCAFESSSALGADVDRINRVTSDSGAVTLILLRHAKSDKSNLNIPDIDRPLEASGREEAREMGEYLKENVKSIDAICSSPSLRTKQTLEIICPIIGFDYARVMWDSSLYACTGDHLLQTIRNQNSMLKTVLYVGHNPSITKAANALQTERNIDEVKTCGAISIYFPVSSWKEISADSSRLNFYAKPR